jgi:predicted esterase
MRLLLVSSLSLFLATPRLQADDIVKRELKAVPGRTYVLYVPPSPRDGELFPLLITLHGSGRDGRSLVERWRPLAKQERIVVAGPDAINRQGWQIPADGPDPLYFLVDEISATVPIDKRRVYLFGHSAGAVFGLSLGLLESEYFAAVSVHAGALNDQVGDVALKAATRRIPYQIQIGTNDSFFPLARVRATRDRLEAAGFPVVYSELAGHTHAYYDRAASINKDAWAFLSSHQLASDPRYSVYGMP